MNAKLKGLMFIALIIQLIICFSQLLAWAEKEPATAKVEEVKGFTMTLVNKDGNKEAIINGSIANILPGGVIEILDVVTRVFDHNDKGADTLIHSAKGTYNRLKNLVDTDQFVRINRRDMAITGTGLHWEPDRNKMKIHRNVRLEYTTERESDLQKAQEKDINGQEDSKVNPGKEDVITVITAEGSGKMNYEESVVAVFRKNVEVDDKNANLKAHLMKMFFDDQTQDLTKVEAYGNVRIKQPKRESSCRKAVYFVDEDKIILSGNPRIVQGQDLYTAETITIYEKGERVVFEPRAELVIYASTEHGEM